jgi:hypothetical protein
LDLSDSCKYIRSQFNEIVREQLCLVDGLSNLLSLALLYQFFLLDSDVELLKDLWMTKNLTFDDKSLCIRILRTNLGTCALPVKGKEFPDMLHYIGKATDTFLLFLLSLKSKMSVDWSFTEPELLIVKCLRHSFFLDRLESTDDAFQDVSLDNVFEILQVLFGHVLRVKILYHI